MKISQVELKSQEMLSIVLRVLIRFIHVLGWVGNIILI